MRVPCVRSDEVRKIDAVQRAKRDPMKIELPPEPIVEKSERAKRDTQIPVFLGVNKRGSDLPSLALLE